LRLEFSPVASNTGVQANTIGEYRLRLIRLLKKDLRDGGVAVLMVASNGSVTLKDVVE
jgi:hypothetical protein